MAQKQAFSRVAWRVRAAGASIIGSGGASTRTNNGPVETAAARSEFRTNAIYHDTNKIDHHSKIDLSSNNHTHNDVGIIMSHTQQQHEQHEQRRQEQSEPANRLDAGLREPQAQPMQVASDEELDAAKEDIREEPANTNAPAAQEETAAGSSFASLSSDESSSDESGDGFFPCYDIKGERENPWTNDETNNNDNNKRQRFQRRTTRAGTGQSNNNNNTRGGDRGHERFESASDSDSSTSTYWSSSSSSSEGGSTPPNKKDGKPQSNGISGLLLVGAVAFVVAVFAYGTYSKVTKLKDLVHSSKKALW